MKLGASVRVCVEWRERERERGRSLTKNRLRGRQAKGDDERKDSVGKIAISSVLVSINSQSKGHSSSVLATYHLVFHFPQASLKRVLARPTHDRRSYGREFCRTAGAVRSAGSP
jgi:hypothetical protein